MSLTEIRTYFPILHRNVLFQKMNDAEIAACLETLSAAVWSYEKNSIIFHAGDLTTRMGIVLDGNVTIEMSDIQGNCTILSSVERNGFFGETYALLEHAPLLVDVVASADTTVLFLSVGTMRKMILSGNTASASWMPKLTASLLMVSLRKNMVLSGRSFHTAPKTIRGKVLSYLTSVSLQKNSREFDIPFDRQRLADYLNVDRTALSKELGKMRAEGLIECRRNHFVLLSD